MVSCASYGKTSTHRYRLTHVHKHKETAPMAFAKEGTCNAAAVVP